jgi:alkylation response protein AidB-like acyl-CoA dehydrogenase
MAWDFETEPEFEAKLAWMREFVKEEIFPLETLAPEFRSPDGRAAFATVTEPLKQQVKDQGLWAAHLPPELGGGTRSWASQSSRLASLAIMLLTRATLNCCRLVAPRNRKRSGCNLSLIRRSVRVSQ